MRDEGGELPLTRLSDLVAVVVRLFAVSLAVDAFVYCASALVSAERADERGLIGK